jgi:hypothetical protein
LLTQKAKNNKKEVPSLSAWAAALGEEGFIYKKQKFLPQVSGISTCGRGFL